MQKLSNQQFAQVLEDGASALRAVVSERDAALNKLASLEQRIEAEKLASAMHNKGLEVDKDFTSLVDHLEKEAQQGNLDEIKRAVEMIAPNMSIKTAHLTSDEVHSGGGSTDFERYLFGDVG
jgi:soluble cytochrome b562